MIEKTCGKCAKFKRTQGGHPRCAEDHLKVSRNSPCRNIAVFEWSKAMNRRFAMEKAQLHGVRRLVDETVREATIRIYKERLDGRRSKKSQEQRTDAVQESQLPRLCRIEPPKSKECVPEKEGNPVGQTGPEVQKETQPGRAVSCSAATKAGTQCKRKPIKDGLCAIHLKARG